MNTNEKTGHANSVPAYACHGDNAPRKLSCWPEHVIEPPFAVTAAAAYAEPSQVSIVSNRRKSPDVAVVSVVLHGYGVTMPRDGVPRGGHGVPRDRDGVPRTEAGVRASFGMSDAASIALEWVAQDLPDTAVMLLLRGCQWYRDASLEPVVPNTWKVYGSAQKWSVAVFDGVPSHPCVGIFQDRASRDAAPSWVWHYLAGRLLLDPVREVVSSGAASLSAYPPSRDAAAAPPPPPPPVRTVTPGMEIRRDVPPPKHASNRTDYPWAAMRPGDSVFFPDEPDGVNSKPGWSARKYASRTRRLYRSAAEDGGVRVWCLS